MSHLVSKILGYLPPREGMKCPNLLQRKKSN
jgi:hypothetical protein